MALMDTYNYINPMKKMNYLLGLLMLVFIPIACEHESTEDDDDCENVTVTYYDDIVPILESKCNNAGCHNYESTYGDFTTYQGIQVVAANETLEEQIESGAMPVGGTLTEDQKQHILCWIENGYLMNGTAPDTTSNSDTTGNTDTTVTDTTGGDTTVALSLCDTLTPTYDLHVKRILDASCLGSSCHKSGSSIGDFTSYSAITSQYLGESGKIYDRVVVQKNMPIGGHTMTQAERDTIECWIKNGALEN